MTRDARWIITLAALLVALATALGAFGAHGLRNVLAPERLEVFETGVRYQFYHALGLLGIGFSVVARERRGVRIAARLIVAGIVCFAGSIFALTFGAPAALGIVTPFGGLLLMAGWVLFALTTWSARGG
ncbi:MAG: membrane protein [Steroidobacteraceae bacterium]